MASDKRVMEYGPAALGLEDVNGKAVDTNDGNVMRLNRAHAVLLLIDIANGADDGTAGGVIDVEYDLYDEAGTTVLFSGDLATDIPIHVDLKTFVQFGGGVTAAAPDGTVDADGDIAIFNRIRFRINVTVASNDTGTCLINVHAHVQE